MKQSYVYNYTHDRSHHIRKSHTKLPTALLGALCQGLKVVPVPSTSSIGEQLTLATRGVVEVPGKGCPARTSDWSCHTAVCAQGES